MRATLIWTHDQSAKWDSLQAKGEIFGLINPQKGLLRHNQSTCINHCSWMKITHHEKVHFSIISRGILIFLADAWVFLKFPGGVFGWVSRIRGSGNSELFFFKCPCHRYCSMSSKSPASEDVSCVWRVRQSVSNEADGFNNSLQLDCDFSVWRGLGDTLITEHDKVLEQKCCAVKVGWHL